MLVDVLHDGLDVLGIPIYFRAEREEIICHNNDEENLISFNFFRSTGRSPLP